MTDVQVLSRKIGEKLIQHGFSICAAESCTGGLFLSCLTDIAGSSAYVLGGVVTYSNAAKMQLVKVREETLNTYGAVSEQTAREMASGVRDLIGADIGISITGIAGPGGGTPDKPVGLVYIGMAAADHVLVSRNVWHGNRVGNKRQSVAHALKLVGDYLDTKSV